MPWILIVSVVMATGAYALPSFPPSPVFSFDTTVPPTLPKCEEILPRMSRLQRITEESHLSLIDFMSGGARLIQEWHQDLSPLEGQSVSLPIGLFDPLEQGANQMTDLSYLAYENSDYISAEMSQLLLALAKCLPTSIPTKGDF